MWVGNKRIAKFSHGDHGAAEITEGEFSFLFFLCVLCASVRGNEFVMGYAEAVIFSCTISPSICNGILLVAVARVMI